MSSSSFTRSRKPSNNYRHGLTSRARAEGWTPGAELLAQELVRGAPRTPEIIQTARLLSGQIILLQAIRKERRMLLTTPPPPKGYENFLSWDESDDIRHEILNSDFEKEAGHLSWARTLIAYARYDGIVAAYIPTAAGTADLLSRQPQAFDRIDTYERKARSRITKLVRRLDFLISEARRSPTQQRRSAS